MPSLAGALNPHSDMYADPILPVLVASTLVVLLLGLALRRLKQPHVVGYLVAGLLLGPHALGLFTDANAVARFGDLGLVLLLFFVGMEMSLERLAANWRVAVIGTILQILVSVLAAWGIGVWLDWPMARSVLLGFVISLSSTAVSVSMLKEWGHLDSVLGQDAMGILIVQDLAVAPMLVVLSLFNGGPTSVGAVSLQVVGGIAVLALGVVLLGKKRIAFPFGNHVAGDHELEVFAAALLCLGLALATAMLGLSTALGAFLAGIIVASSDATEWVADSLHPFRVILLAMFFVSIGLMIDLEFIGRNATILAALVAGVLLTNTVANAVIVRVFGRSWRHSFLVGAMLAQAGDFSFVLAAIGLESGVITSYGYQLIISVIFASLVLSPAWITPFRALADRESP